ncbi:hypothetical protein AGLY_018082 [Aphis glycines]|uniref:Uncharacterized protein n=1 Tax=Aphis glycines TaxID=307491 RepID=A0A6G0ST24_APHGL|nr:hypothetical protein AGLY_018082 [Aphis glycines]
MTGIDLREECFSHEQFYITYSRVSSASSLVILAPKGSTRNTVCKDNILPTNYNITIHGQPRINITSKNRQLITNNSGRDWAQTKGYAAQMSTNKCHGFKFKISIGRCQHISSTALGKSRITLEGIEHKRRDLLHKRAQMEHKRTAVVRIRFSIIAQGKPRITLEGIEHKRRDLLHKRAQTNAPGLSLKF